MPEYTSVLGSDSQLLPTMDVDENCLELSILSPNSLGLVADVFKSLGEPSRLHILCTLRTGPKNVTEIMQLTGLGQANTSKHLKLLTQQNLVSRRQEGVCVYYEVASPRIFELCSIVCQLISEQIQQQKQQLAELRQLHQGH
jgi:DNA-binding transcriptional ArsR family regulator